jgi:hypothetical protein
MEKAERDYKSLTSSDRARKMDEDFWEDLLTLIEGRKVIPVIGEHAVTTAPDDARLYDWLALRLAESLGIPPEGLPDKPTLNQVVTAWLLKGGERNKIYTRLHRILRDESPAPGSTLRHLAAIPAFNLFLTTTFDRLLERALNEARFGGAERTKVCAFWPEAAEKDLPARKRELGVPTVYHILGRVSAAPEFVVWEEDALDFVCALQQHLPVMEKLARDLKEHGLLILGLNFSDWLVRFFLRIAKQSRLSEPRTVTEYLMEGSQDLLPQSMVLFFSGLTRSVHVIACEPSEFAAELATRWRERYPDSLRAREIFSPPPPPTMPSGAIFISYAREDESAVIRLKMALEQAGCVVWYDRERLKGGMYWPDQLEDEISSRCSVFLSVVSRATESAPEGYFHRERSWAASRAPSFSLGEEFYVPVIIDDSAFELKREPRIAKLIQTARAMDGNPLASFVEHLCEVQQRRVALPQPVL